MKDLHLEGKVVESCHYVDSYDGGVVIGFTDGTVLKVVERMQAGELCVLLNADKLPTRGTDDEN